MVDGGHHGLSELKMWRVEDFGLYDPHQSALSGCHCRPSAVEHGACHFDGRLSSGLDCRQISDAFCQDYEQLNGAPALKSCIAYAHHIFISSTFKF